MTEIGQSSKEKAIFHTVFMTNHGDGQKLDALTHAAMMRSQASSIPILRAQQAGKPSLRRQGNP
jgi:hypothetical protein